MSYTPFEVREALDSMVVLVDTREQDTDTSRARLALLGRPYERVKLDVGDYACSYLEPSTGERRTLPVAVERKMSADELCLCFGKERKRFEREFERAKAQGWRMHLLVENVSWEQLYAGRYRSLLSVKALVASMLAWSIRYDIRIWTCRNETSGRLISDILYRELKEELEGGDG